MINDYIKLSPDEVIERFNLSLKGLTSEEVEKRQYQYGLNLIKKRKSKSMVSRFLLQLRDWFSILLLVASFLSFISGEWQLGYVILIIVFLNAILSLVQEYRAEKAMESLKTYIPEYAKAVRNGKLQQVLVKNLVPGDLIVLQGGDRVPADARLIEANELWANNVPLTGESEPQQRTARAEKDPDISYLDAANMVFMSTSIVAGEGKAFIIDTGKNTKFGQIASLTSEIQAEMSPLQKEIEKTAKYNFLLALGFGGIFFFISVIFLENALDASILFFIGV
ncbi:MAG: cation-transporting P-type ATPase, partial [Candidatus Helarchaeota archaeon]|nr:cation-transporting P-type ATPase [Candidatus Helarchaeota archaeon]